MSKFHSILEMIQCMGAVTVH